VHFFYSLEFPHVSLVK